MFIHYGIPISIYFKDWFGVHCWEWVRPPYLWLCFEGKCLCCVSVFRFLGSITEKEGLCERERDLNAYTFKVDNKDFMAIKGIVAKGLLNMLIEFIMVRRVHTLKSSLFVSWIDHSSDCLQFILQP